MNIKKEKKTLTIVAISGVIYNIGMIAGPWFEGQLVQRLLDIMTGKRIFIDMVSLAGLYLVTIALVQSSRFIKRLYVRIFANHLNRDMKQKLYHSVVYKSRRALEAEGMGNLMTKAIADVDTCVEGVRKFTTEIFDTGVVMIAYLAMLLIYDWRLTLLSMIFPPLAYVVAEKLKVVVAKSAEKYKKSAGRLNSATLDRISNAMTYRVFGQEEHQNVYYEQALTEYEKKAAFANIWETAMQPIYQIIATISVIFILWFGGKNVLGNGWSVWNIAAFTTYLSCFTKLAVKSSKAAKLFNAVQKAKVSWKRVEPFLSDIEDDSNKNDSNKDDSNKDGSNQNKDLKEQADREGNPNQENKRAVCQLKEGSQMMGAEHLSFHYPEEESYIFKNLNFEIQPGEILGVAGPVACGKSTLGKVFLREYSWEGTLYLPGQVAYMGHRPELISATIEENILLGSEGDAMPFLKAVCMDEEVMAMENGMQTMIGNGGIRLSGGQQARIALARTLCHKKKCVILDDPFSAVDKQTEQKIMNNIRPLLKANMVIILSHRLALFPGFNQVLWMGNGEVSPHEILLQTNAEYAKVYEMQMGGVEDEIQE